MNWVGSKLRNPFLVRLLVVVPLMVAGLLYFAMSSNAAVVPRNIVMSDSRVSATANYTLNFTLTAPEVLGSIELQFCSNSPLIGTLCTAPSGFDISSATLSGQSGETGFSIYGPGTNTNTIVLGRAPLASGGGSVSYALDGVVNPDTLGSFYARLQTFASNDASGPENEHGGLALSLNEAFQISTTVPPYLLFCGGVTIGGFDCNNASGSYINFGNLTAAATVSASSQLLSATNAANGFNIGVYGTTMTSGNNVIAAIPAQDVSRPGTQQFGLNLVANTTPLVGSAPQGPGSAVPSVGYNLSDWFKFVSGDTIASTPAVDDFRKLTVSYILNIPIGQPSGVYTTTLTYICLANF